MLNKFANVPLDEVRGIRTPYLQGGGDEMFDMLRDSGRHNFHLQESTFNNGNFDFRVQI